MKRLALALAGVLIAGSALANGDGHHAPPPLPPPAGCAVITDTWDGFLNIRLEPTTFSPVIGILWPGNIVPVDPSSVQGWVHIPYPVAGWISTDFALPTICPR